MERLGCPDFRPSPALLELTADIWLIECYNFQRSGISCNVISHADKSNMHAFQHSVLACCRSVGRLGAPATKRRPAPKRQRCGPHIKDEGGGPAFLLPRDPDHEGEVADGGSDQETHEEECQLQAKHGLLLHGLR